MTATSRAHPAASLSSTHPSISPSTHSSISPSASWLCPGLCLLSERCGAVRAELACCCRLTRVSSSGVLTSCLFLWRHFCVCCRLRGVRGSSVDTMWPCKQHNFHGFSPKCQKYIWRCLIWSFMCQENIKLTTFCHIFGNKYSVMQLSSKKIKTCEFYRPVNTKNSNCDTFCVKKIWNILLHMPKIKPFDHILLKKTHQRLDKNI